MAHSRYITGIHLHTDGRVVLMPTHTNAALTSGGATNAPVPSFTAARFQRGGHQAVVGPMPRHTWALPHIMSWQIHRRALLPIMRGILGTISPTQLACPA